MPCRLHSRTVGSEVGTGLDPRAGRGVELISEGAVTYDLGACKDDGRGTNAVAGDLTTFETGLPAPKAPSAPASKRRTPGNGGDGEYIKGRKWPY